MKKILLSIIYSKLKNKINKRKIKKRLDKILSIYIKKIVNNLKIKVNRHFYQRNDIYI